MIFLRISRDKYYTMQFDEAVKHKIGKTLKKIRIKVDPSHASAENYRLIDSYEGYVLEENDQIVRLMVLKSGMPVVSVEKDALIACDTLTKFKAHLKDFVKFIDSDPTSLNIQSASTYEDIEIFLLQYGLSHADICNIYRNFLDEEI